MATTVSEKSDNIAPAEVEWSSLEAAAAADPAPVPTEQAAVAATPIQQGLTAAPTLLPYPADLDVKLQGTVYTPEDFPKLLETYGKYLIVLGRYEDGIVGFVAVTGLVKLGVFGRCMKPVPAGKVLSYLSSGAEVFTGRAEILVCTPPLSGDQALLLAEIALSEESYFSSKLPILSALDAAMAFDSERVAAHIEDMIRYLSAAKASYDTRVVEVEPPTGEWNIYSKGGGIPQPDRLTSAIKGFASHSTRVFPPLPPLDPLEVDAIIQIHDLLVANKMEDHAQRFINTVLSAPAFARLCHRPELFAADRRPRLQAQWGSFGPPMLQYLLSEELTHAARRDTHYEKVTAATPYVLTLREILALGVPHAPLSEQHAFERLDTYVGGYLADLDLSRTLITGSAIAAALIVTDVERYHYEHNTWGDFVAESGESLLQVDEDKTGSAEASGGSEEDATAAEDAAVERNRLLQERSQRRFQEWSRSVYGRGFEAYLAAHYPPTKTVPRDRDAYLELAEGDVREGFARRYTFLTEEIGGKFVLTVRAADIAQTPGAEEAGDPREAVLDVASGADVDMAVDVETNEEFDRVAEAHFRAIRAKHPYAVLTKVPREDPQDVRYNWSITCACPGAVSTFRPVEIYRANFNHVVTHHVGMVSGAYTALFGGPPTFVVSARLAHAMCNLATPNYYYFASRKNAPQFIVMKYYMRGFGLKAFPSGITRALLAVMSQDPVWQDDYDDGYVYPASHGKGFFSAYSLPDEKAAMLHG